ncbi:MAG: LysR substrate-binding domain-containing protein [Caulobacteraceae bacterium]
MARRALPSLNALKALEAFARHGRMTTAADELCVTHGAISRQIKQLEAALGVALIEGPKSARRLTVAGAGMTPALTQAFDLIERSIPRHAPEANQTLKVSCIGTFAMKWLIPRLPAFVDRYPGADVRILESFGTVELGSTWADVAIRIQNETWPAELEATPFLPNHVGPVLAPALAARDGELFGLPRLRTDTRPQAWEEWAGLVGATLPAGGVERGFEHNYYMLEAATAGLGVAVAPWPLVAPDVLAGRLVAPMGFTRKAGDFVLLRLKSARGRLAIRFRDWLVEEGARSPTAPMAEA